MRCSLHSKHSAVTVDHQVLVISGGCSCCDQEPSSFARTHITICTTSYYIMSEARLDRQHVQGKALSEAQTRCRLTRYWPHKPAAHIPIEGLMSAHLKALRARTVIPRQQKTLCSSSAVPPVLLQVLCSCSSCTLLRCRNDASSALYTSLSR
jgi:hypothetical protein